MVNPEKIQRLEAMTTKELYLLLNQLETSLRQRRIERYVPRKELIPFHKSLARKRAVFGANRSGKTTAGMVEYLNYLRGKHPYRRIVPPVAGWVVTPDLEMARDTHIPMMLQYLPSSEIKRFNRLEMSWELTNGSITKYKSGESDVSKFMAAERRIIWFDEQPRKDIWDECNMRTGVDQPLDIILTMTPLLGMDWSYDEIYCGGKPGELEVFTLDLMGATFLPLEERLRLMELFREHEDAPARLFGRYFARSGMIYKEFSRESHVVEPFPVPSNWPVVVAIDPHPRKPSVALFGAISEEGVLYIFDEMTAGDGERVADFGVRVREALKYRRVFRRLIDPSSEAADVREGRTIRDELRGVGVPTQLANNNLFFGLEIVRSRFRGKTLAIFANCRRLIWEVEHYIWKEHREERRGIVEREEPRKQDDHLCDCLRYICASKVRYEEPTYETFFPAASPYLDGPENGKFSGY